MNTQHSHTVNWKVSICRPHSEKSVRQRASARLWACPVQTNAQLRTFRCSSAALRPQPALPAAAPRTQRHSRPAALRTDAAASESGTRPADLVPPAAGPTPGAEDPASAQLQQHQGQRPLAAHSGEGRWRGGRLVFLLSATLAAGGGARAEEVVPQSADWVVSVVFTLALAALALVTLGVVYLSFTSWRDKRIEKQDRERLVQSEKDRKLQALGVAPRPRKKFSDVPTRGGGKGFGG